eukprot:Skav210835  [mRNA]  locus=scaffold543:10295:14459:- [translate_table: standard]
MQGLRQASGCPKLPPLGSCKSLGTNTASATSTASPKPSQFCVVSALVGDRGRKLMVLEDPGEASTERFERSLFDSSDAYHA